MKQIVFTSLILLLFSSCKKDQEVYENNTPPPYSGISTLQVQNYVNRVFIDLVGREPLDTEMTLEVDLLESNSLSKSSREALINKLQTNTSSIPGDSSYYIAYHKKLYEDTKARLLEGVSDDYIQGEVNLFEGLAYADSLNGNLVGYELNTAEANKLKSVLTAQFVYRTGNINEGNLYASMLNNSIYDNINMNSFNFINASFDNLYYRFPTTAEFDLIYPIIEFNTPSQIFGEVAQNKGEYISIITSNEEFYEGLVSWAFNSLLARDANSNERFSLTNNLLDGESLAVVQKNILITDEYAGFE